MKVPVFNLRILNHNSNNTFKNDVKSVSRSIDFKNCLSCFKLFKVEILNQVFEIVIIHLVSFEKLTFRHQVFKYLLLFFCSRLWVKLHNFLNGLIFFPFSFTLAFIFFNLLSLFIRHFNKTKFTLTSMMSVVFRNLLQFGRIFGINTVGIEVILVFTMPGIALTAITVSSEGILARFVNESRFSICCFHLKYETADCEKFILFYLY